MATEKEKYLKSLDDLEFITSIAWNISVDTQGRQVDNWNTAYSSIILGKLCLHAHAVLQLMPNLDSSNRYEIVTWDISSIATIVRALIESYYVFYYLGVDSVTEDELELRNLLWMYHSEKQRLDMLKMINSNNPIVKQIEKGIEELKQKFKKNTYYQTLSSSRKSKIVSGKIGILHSNSELSRRAGINPDYYKSNFNYLSAYVHAFPYAYSQLNLFRAGDDESLHIIRTNIDLCIGYICHAIRDFLKIMPDQKKHLDKKAKKLIDDWEYIFSSNAEII